MNKPMIIVIVCLMLFPLPIQASSFTIVDDKKVNKKIVREHFRLPTIDSIFIDMEMFRGLEQEIKKKVFIPPQNATFDKNDAIISASSGEVLDELSFFYYFQMHFYEQKNGEMKVPIKKVYPRIDDELLSEINKKEIGSFSTNFQEKNRERSHNIRLAAAAIDGHVLFPEETFSFNQVVGERTREKGYKRAPVIVKGEIAEDLGGGICQVSSTLFNAVQLRGIQMKERYSHSRNVPYVAPGKDATVSWWGPDFSFQNKYQQPILIRSEVKDGRLTVRVFSTDLIRS